MHLLILVGEFSMLLMKDNSKLSIFLFYWQTFNFILLKKS